jgi:penicillin-binding protein 1A
VVLLDPRNGQILAMVASRDYSRDDIEGKNNNLFALNSPGSALKPFVYLTHSLKTGSGSATLIEDAPIAYKQPDGSTFSPKNPTGQFHGWITARTALGNSLNIPAFRTAEGAGVQNVVDLGKKSALRRWMAPTVLPSPSVA